MNAPIPLEDAQRRLLSLVRPLDTENVPASDAAGRYLAHDLIARRTQPAADLSAMDGFAVAGSGPWRIVGESRAGHPHRSAVTAGEAVSISTGALVPEGADGVLIKEEAFLSGNDLSAVNGSASARFIRRTGFDFECGDVVLPAQSRIDPAILALATMAGHCEVVVRRRPHVAILDCGDELASDPATRDPHLIPASNGPMLTAMARAEGAVVTRPPPVPDRLDALRDVLRECGDADLIVTSGGASVGEHDLIRPALEAIGARMEFWRVAMKPGKPLLVATRGRQIIVGLPGNPVSSFVTGWLFMLPVLRALAGSSAPLPAPIDLPLAEDIGPGGTRREFLRALRDEGALIPIAERDSSALAALATAEALIDRPANAAEAKKGTYVPAYLLRNGGIA